MLRNSSSLFVESFEGHFWLKFDGGGVGEGFGHAADLWLTF